MPLNTNSNAGHWMRQLVGALSLCPALLLSGCDKLDLLSTSEHIAKAREELAAKNPKAAEIHLKNALQKEPKNVDGRILLSMTYLKMNRGQAAEVELGIAEQFGATPEATLLPRVRSYVLQRQFGRVLKEMPAQLTGAPEHVADLNEVRGDAQAALGLLDEAGASYDAVLAVRPNATEAMYGKARIAASRNDLAAAIDQVDRALAIAPRSTTGLLLKGNFLFARQDTAAATELFKAAVAATPEDDAARIALGSALVRAKNFDGAMEQVTEVLKRSPNSPQGNYLLSVMQFAQQRYKDAFTSVQKVTAAAPDYLPALLLTASIQYQTGSLLQADANAQRYVAAVPGSIAARKLLAAILLKERKPKDVMAVLEPVLAQTDYRDAQVYALAGAAMGQLNQPDQAVAYLEKAASLSPSDVPIQTSVGVGNLAKGDVDKAIVAFESVLQLDTGTDDSNSLLVLGYMSKKDYQKAVDVAQSLVKAHPQNATYFNLLGGAYRAQQNLDAARTNFMRSLELRPDLAPAAMNLAQLEMDAGKPDAARKWLTGVLEKNPKNMDVLNSLASVEFKDNHPEAGLRSLESAAKLNPDLLAPQLRLISYHGQQRDWRRSLDIAREASAKFPSDVDLLVAMATSQTQLGDYDGAIASYLRLATLLPREPKLQVEIGRLETVAGNTTAARSAFEKALTLSPGFVEGQIMLAELETKLGRYDVAARLVAQLEKKPETLAAARLLSGDIAMGQRRHGAAVKAYEEAFAASKNSIAANKLHAAMWAGGDRRRADDFLSSWIARNPKDETSRLYFAGALLMAGNGQRAEGFYREVLALNADNVVALNELALLTGTSNPSESLRLAEHAYRLRPNNASIGDTYGWILVTSGDVERGQKLLAKVVDATPSNVEARYHLALALLKSGDRAAAKSNLKQVLATTGEFAHREEARQLFGRL